MMWFTGVFFHFDAVCPAEHQQRAQVLSATDVDHDNLAEIALVATGGGGREVSLFDPSLKALALDFQRHLLETRDVRAPVVDRSVEATGSNAARLATQRPLEIARHRAETVYEELSRSLSAQPSSGGLVFEKQLEDFQGFRCTAAAFGTIRYVARIDRGEGIATSAVVTTKEGDRRSSRLHLEVQGRDCAWTYQVDGLEGYYTGTEEKIIAAIDGAI